MRIAQVVQVQTGPQYKAQKKATVHSISGKSGAAWIVGTHSKEKGKKQIDQLKFDRSLSIMIQ